MKMSKDFGTPAGNATATKRIQLRRDLTVLAVTGCLVVRHFLEVQR